MITTKRYLIFAYDAYYPAGGWSDFKEAFDDYPSALEFADKLQYSDGIELVDLETLEDIYVYPQYR